MCWEGQKEKRKKEQNNIFKIITENTRSQVQEDEKIPIKIIAKNTAPQYAIFKSRKKDKVLKADRGKKKKNDLIIEK